MMCRAVRIGSLAVYGGFRGVTKSSRQPACVVWIRTGPWGRACRGQGGPGLGDPGPSPALRLGDAGTRSSYCIRAVSAEPSCRRSSLRSGPPCSLDQYERESPREAPGLDLLPANPQDRESPVDHVHRETEPNSSPGTKRSEVSYCALDVPAARIGNGY